MAAYDNLRAVIAANVYQNNNNEVTADMVKAAMNAMVASLGAEFQFGGVAEPDDNPGTPDYKVAYLASTPGTYSNFGGIVLDEGEVAVIKWSGSWSKETTGIVNFDALGSVELVAREIDAKLHYESAGGSFLPSQSSLIQIFAPFFLKSGKQYKFSAKFDAQPAEGSQVNLYVVPAVTLSGNIGVLYLYASSWNTLKTATITPTVDGMYCIIYRYLGGVIPGATISAELTNPLYLGELGALANYRINPGNFNLGNLILGKLWADDETPVTNNYRICTQIFRLATSNFRVSCNYQDGFTYYVYQKRNGAFVAVASNVGQDTDFYFPPGAFYIAVRALNGRAVTEDDLTDCALSVYMYDATYNIVLDVMTEIAKAEEQATEQVDELARILLADNIVDVQFEANSTSYVTVVAEDFFLKSGKQYKFSAQFDAQPTNDAQVNLWIYKMGTTSGMLSRIILHGGDDWAGERTALFVPQEDGKYYVSYRVVYGGAQNVTISAKINNPLIAESVPDDSSILPDYYFPYIEERTTDAKLEMAKCGAGSVAAFLISDTHQPQNFGMSGKMLRYLNERLQVSRTLYGGDICPSLTSSWGGAAGTAEDGIALADNAITQLLSNVRGRIYRIKGNHDYSLANFTYWRPDVAYNVGDIRVWASSYSQGADNKAYRCVVANSDAIFDPTKWELYGEGGAELSQIQTQRLILADAEAAGNCVFQDNSKASYYYFDIQYSKLRVLCWDCSDSDAGFTGISDVRENISDAQFKWMAAAILSTPAGYNIVSFGHIPAYVNQSIGVGGYQTAAWNLTKRNLYAAVNENGTFTIGGETFNFANLSAKIIIEIAGHTHADCITNIGGMFALSIAGDWWTDFTKYSPVYYHFGLSSLASRVGGTTREQAFDLVIFDAANNFIKFLRFGAGIDRWLNLNHLSVGVGETLEIEPSLAGNVEYYVYDSDLREQDTDGHYRPTSTRASIDADGVLTAISAGGVVVMAYDTTNHIVEVFGATIE